MFETEKPNNVGDSSKMRLIEQLTNTKRKLISRREAMKKAGGTIIGTGLIFLGIGLPRIPQQKSFACDCERSCAGGCATDCSIVCTGNCAGSCTGTCDPESCGARCIDVCAGTCESRCDTICNTDCIENLSGSCKEP